MYRFYCERVWQNWVPRHVCLHWLQGTYVKPQDFEVSAGKTASKKWRQSIRVRGTEHDRMMIGDFLHMLKVWRRSQCQSDRVCSHCALPSPLHMTFAPPCSIDAASARNDCLCAAGHCQRQSRAICAIFEASEAGSSSSATACVSGGCDCFPAAKAGTYGHASGTLD